MPTSKPIIAIAVPLKGDAQDRRNALAIALDMIKKQIQSNPDDPQLARLLADSHGKTLYVSVSEISPVPAAAEAA